MINEWLGILHHNKLINEMFEVLSEYRHSKTVQDAGEITGLNKRLLQDTCKLIWKMCLFVCLN